MGQSLVQNYLHIVFSTKYRQPLISESIESELYSYIASTCNSLESCALQVGGYRDHVHILCQLSKKIALMKLLEQVKVHSSKWMKTKGGVFNNFYWQDGYGAFSVSASAVETVKKYIENQKQHHERHTFQDEFRASLQSHQVEYDERYVWD